MKLTLLSGLAGASLLLAACDVDKTQDGEMPDVDVDVEGGKLPQYDVDTPDVDVGTEDKTITVPVPTIDVQPPNDDDDDAAPGNAADGDQ